MKEKLEDQARRNTIRTIPPDQPDKQLGRNDERNRGDRPSKPPPPPPDK